MTFVLADAVLYQMTSDVISQQLRGKEIGLPEPASPQSVEGGELWERTKLNYSSPDRKHNIEWILECETMYISYSSFLPACPSFDMFSTATA